MSIILLITYLLGTYDTAGVKGVSRSSVYLLLYFPLGKEINMPPGDKPQEHGSTQYNIGIKSKHKAHDSYKWQAFRKNDYTYAHTLGFDHFICTGLDSCIW